MVLILFLLIFVPYSYQKSTASPHKPAYFSNETCSANYYEYSYEQCKWIPQLCGSWYVYIPERQECGRPGESKECTGIFDKLQATFMWTSLIMEQFCYENGTAVNGKIIGEICSDKFVLCHDYRAFVLQCKRYELFDGKSCRGYDSCRPEDRSKELHIALKEPVDEDIPEFTCRGKRDGYYALFSCSRNYIRCVRGKYQFKSCIGNERFSPITKRCENQEKICACGNVILDDKNPAVEGSLERARQHSNPSDYCLERKAKGWKELFHAQVNSFGSIIYCLGKKTIFQNRDFPKEFSKHNALSIVKSGK